MAKKPKKAASERRGPYGRPAKGPTKLILVRARNGDWSLRHPEAEEQRLLSGASSKIDGDWDRPIERDYELAWMMYHHFVARVDAVDRD
jgi:hypothetical protein